MGGYMHLMQSRDGIIHLIGSHGSGTGAGNNEVISFSEQWLRHGACLDVAEWGINTAGMVALCPGEDPPDSTMRLLSSAKPVTAASSVENYGWLKSCLTDNITHSNSAAARGYSSLCNSLKTDTEWVEIDLGQDMAFNEVVLYPRTDLIGAFPEDFTIEARTNAGVTTEVYSVTGWINPDSAAYTASFQRMTARYVRLTATKLGAQIQGDGCYRLQLSEMQVYDHGGTTNTPLHAGSIHESPLGMSVFPVPFNPSCAVFFNLPATGPALLEVLDISGRRIALLGRGRMAAGAHRTAWNATGMAAGVYVLRLKTGASVLTKKIVLAQ